jgi:ubiquinol-cytochrome c reductase subunit 8
MRVSPVALGKRFGNLGKIYGQYRFGLAPNELKPFHGFFDNAFVRIFKEYVWRDWPYYVPPAVASYLVYDWAIKENYRFNRKDPADYENDT